MRITLLIFFSLLIVAKSLAQSVTVVKSEITKDVMAINNSTGYKKIKLNAGEFLDHTPDGGGELTGYLRGGKFVKIRQWIGLSYGNRVMEFYLKNGKLIFVYEKVNSFVYDKDRQAFDYTKTETTFEGRYYFRNDTLIDYVTLGHNRFEDDSIDPGKVLISEANEKIEKLKKKK